MTTLIGLQVAGRPVLVAGGGREAARRSSCTNNMKQFGIALSNYHGALKTFPPGGCNDPKSKGYFYSSPHAMLLPFFEEEGLHSVYDLKKDGVGYSTSGGKIDDIKSKLEDYKAQIISGKVTVPTKPASG